MVRDILLIPTYNEKLNIVELIHKVFAVVPTLHIMIVDDNSSDGTADVVEDLMKKYSNLSLFRRPKKEGLGLAYIDAFQTVLKNSDVRAVIFMDADFSHDPKYLPAILQRLDTHDVVIGSRYVAEGSTEGWTWHRRMLSKFGNLYCRSITGMPIHDCTAGFNAIRTDILRKINFEYLKRFRGYAFMMALKHTLWKAGAQFYEVPITFRDRVRGKSKMSQQIVREGMITPWKLYFEGAPFGGYGKYVAGLTLIGLFVRLGAIGFGIPYDNVFGDEIAHVLAAFHLLEEHTIFANFPFYYLPPLMAYMTIPFILLGGLGGMFFGVFQGIAGMREFVILHREYFLMAPRIVSALVSAAAVPMIFLLARNLFNARVAFLASIFLTFDFLHIHESQIGHIWGPMTFFILAAFYALYRVYRSGRLRYYYGAAITIGFGYGLGQIPLFLYPWMVAAHCMSARMQGQRLTRKLFDRKFLYANILLLLVVFVFTALNPITLYKHINDVLQAFDVFFGTHFGSVFHTPFTAYSNTEKLSLVRNWGVIGTIFVSDNIFLLAAALLGVALYMRREPYRDLFKKIIVIAWPLVYLIVFSILFFRFTLRYVLPATPLMLIMSAYFFDQCFEKFSPWIRRCAWVVLFISGGYSMAVSGYYWYLLQQPYTISEGIEWLYTHVSPGNRVIADHYINSNKESIHLLEQYHGSNALDQRRQLLLTLPDSRVPQPNYFFIDTNALDFAVLPSREQAADFIFLSFYYPAEKEEKKAILKWFPEATLVKSIYPTGSSNPVYNLLNLDPRFPEELFSLSQLGPNVEIYQIIKK